MRFWLVVLALWSGLVWAETPSETAEKAYNAAVDVAKKEFDAKVKVAKDKYVSVLKVQMTELTKKGDLDGALKIKAKIAELEKPEESIPAKITISREAVTGSWTINYDNGVTFVHVFKADGTLKNGETKTIGKWTEAAGKILYSWGTRKEEMIITENNKCVVRHWPVAGQEREIDGTGIKN